MEKVIEKTEKEIEKEDLMNRQRSARLLKEKLLDKAEPLFFWI